ncbi:MAG: hypothetical protein J6L02_04365, partial [Bacteroidales bacterium]|nr:hypothetical protein [Bacteroidales bacterium]
ERSAPGMKVLDEQLLMFQRGSKAHDDAPDALEGAIWMLKKQERSMAFTPRMGRRTKPKSAW